MRKLSYLLMTIVIALLFVGCAGSTPQIPTQIDTLKKGKVEKVNKTIKLIDGTLFINGKKHLDENGDIVMAFIKNDVTYYILKDFTNGEKFILKNTSNRVIKNFDGIAKILKFETYNEVYLAVQYTSKTSLYNKYEFDNVYEFDGKKLKLVNKNLYIGDLSKGKYDKIGYMRTSGKFFTRLAYDPSMSSDAMRYKGHILYDPLSGKEITIEPKYNTREYQIIGTANDIVLYKYKRLKGFLQSETIIEAKNLNSGETKVLKAGDTLDIYIQLWKHGNQYILKIFNDSIESESKYGNEEAWDSKYINYPSKNIYLNTLSEVNTIPENFELLPLFQSFNKIGGRQTGKTYITYRIYTLDEMTSKLPLF